jgi:hypothetical protein
LCQNCRWVKPTFYVWSMLRHGPTSFVTREVSDRSGGLAATDGRYLCLRPARGIVMWLCSRIAVTEMLCRCQTLKWDGWDGYRILRRASYLPQATPLSFPRLRLRSLRTQLAVVYLTSLFLYIGRAGLFLHNVIPSTNVTHSLVVTSLSRSLITASSHHTPATSTTQAHAVARSIASSYPLSFAWSNH